MCAIAFVQAAVRGLWEIAQHFLVPNVYAASVDYKYVVVDICT